MGQSKSKQSGANKKKESKAPSEETSVKKNGNNYISPSTGQTANRPPPDSPVTPTPAPNNDSNSAIKKAIAEGKKVVQGLYPYEAAAGNDSQDLSFDKGDLMIVEQQEGEWWFAEHMLTHRRGYIPYNYVAEYNGLERFDWFHGKISRKDAENLLCSPGNPRGAFLIRESESSAGTYSLSVRDEDVSPDKWVKHYRIRDLDNGGCYISPKQKFTSMEELIQFYSDQPDGLCYRLISPCRKVQPTMHDLCYGMKDKYEIPRSEVRLLKQLGAGNFGEVWEGVWKNTTKVAIKTLKVGTMEPSKFLDEAEIMKKLQHEHIVTLYAVCSREEPIYIVCELMNHGSLLQCLRDEKQRPLLMWHRLLDIAAQVADGMRYVEGKGYIHRDLAARNVLVGASYKVKIGDFGLARDDETYDAKLGSKFPIKWTAPEAAMYGKFTIKSDVWAYGILLVELVTYGQIPYPGMSNSEVLTQLERGYRHPQPMDCADDMYEIMMTCWKKSPEERPTFDHLFYTMDNYHVSVERQYADTS